jgi:hypothetical protein
MRDLRLALQPEVARRCPDIDRAAAFRVWARGWVVRTPARGRRLWIPTRVASPGAALARIPHLEDRLDAAGPRHQYRISGIEHDDGWRLTAASAAMSSS